jgi:hypothetical protein
MVRSGRSLSGARAPDRFGTAPAGTAGGRLVSQKKILCIQFFAC